jgi:hypothetical protein
MSETTWTPEGVKTARRDGTLRQKLRELVKEARYNTSVNNTYARVQVHLLSDEKAFCRELERKRDPWD